MFFASYLESWLTKCGKSSISVDYLDIPNRPSRKQHFWIRRSKSKLTVAFFWMFLRWKNFWLCPLDWNVDKLNMQKGSIIIVVCRFSNWLISKATGLKSFDNISIEMFLVKIGLCVKMICFLFDHFFMRHIDRKYRSSNEWVNWRVFPLGQLKNLELSSKTFQCVFEN